MEIKILILSVEKSLESEIHKSIGEEKIYKKYLIVSKS